MKTFDELNLISPLQRALANENYVTPTPVQAQTIPAALQGRDVLGCAQTGTGKTAAFALPILNWLGEIDCRAIPKRPAALVLAPTRELALQIGESFATYGRHLRVQVAMVFGGVNQAQQVRNLNRGAHIVVATPGRLLDLMNQGHIELNFLRMFVLDEADQMLNMGFLPDLKRIISRLPQRRQSLFFSATLPARIQDLSRSLLRDPIHVNVTPKSPSVARIEQRVMFVERGAKLDALRKILSDSRVGQTLIFSRTKRGANQLSEKLVRCGISATAIHGNKSQNARIRALDAFRRNDVQVLVATDVAARGIDIDDISHVVNYDMPVEPESYVHRIGRTGRAGADGIALTFCSSAERADLRAIEKLIGQRIPLATEPAMGESTDRVEIDRSIASRPAVRAAAKSESPGKARFKSPRRASVKAVPSPAPRGAYSQHPTGFEVNQPTRPVRSARRRRPRRSSLRPAQT